MDGGTALHAACWVGNVRMVERLLEHGGVRSTRATRPTRAHRWVDRLWIGPPPRARVDYPAVAERLVAAGADITAIGNKENRSLLSMADGNKAMQEALRRLGAT